MKLQLLGFVILLVFLLAAPQAVRAGAFYLKTIGELNVQNTTLSQYWYSGSNPTLTGSAPANSEVKVTVNGTLAGTTTSDANGNWSQAVSLNDGDNTVMIEAEGVSPYTFTLTKGELPEGVGAITTTETPPAGIAFPTLILIILGIAAISSPIFFRYALTKAE